MEVSAKGAKGSLLTKPRGWKKIRRVALFKDVGCDERRTIVVDHEPAQKFVANRWRGVKGNDVQQEGMRRLREDDHVSLECLVPKSAYQL